MHDAAGGGSITIDWARNASFAAGELTFGELTAICRELRRLLSEARPLSAPDLAALGTPVTTTIDTDLAARCSTAVEALQAAAAASDPHADGPWLRSAVALGVRGAATVLLQPTPDPQLIAGTAAELQRRTVALDALRAPASDADQLARLRLCFGEDFLALPSFALADAGAVASAATAAAGAGFPDQAALRTWLTRAAAVRPPDYRFSGLDSNVDYELHAEHGDFTSATRTVSSFNSSRDIEVTLKLSHKKKSS